MNSTILAGLIADVLLALVFMGYLLVGGRAFVDILRQEDDMQRIPENTLFWLCLAGFSGAAITLGAIAGLIYGWIDSAQLFLGLSFGLAILASALAFLTRTPMPYDKVFMNLAVAGVLGVAIPSLVG